MLVACGTQSLLEHSPDLPIEDGFRAATMASKIHPFQYRLAIANFGAVYL